MMMLLVLLSVVGVLGQQSGLVPSASRNPPPVHIPTPYDQHHANSVFSSNGEKHHKSKSHHKSESHEKKSKKEKLSSDDAVETDDLYYLFPDPVAVAGDKHSDGYGDGTPPSKIDIPLPPTYQLPQPPAAGVTASPTVILWKVDYDKGYTDSAHSSSKGKNSSKGSSKGSGRTPNGGSIYLPPVPDCYEYGVNRCPGADQPQPAPVRSPVYNGGGPKRERDDDDGGNKREHDDDDEEKEEKLQKKTPEVKQEIPPITVSMPTPSIGMPSVSRTGSPSLFPAASTIAHDPTIAAPAHGGPNPVPPSSGSLSPSPDRMPDMGTSAPALAIVTSPVVASPIASPVVASPLASPAATSTLPSSAAPIMGPASEASSTGMPASLNQGGTGVPTLAPALEIFGTGLRAIQTDPVYLRVTGDFDPAQEEDVFYRNLVLLFGPYSRANVGERLQETQLTVDFITDPASAAARTATKLQIEQTSWCEVAVVYLISGDSYFSSSLGTEFLQQFFVGTNKQNFIARLKSEGVDITSLETFDDFPISLTDDDMDNEGEESVAPVPEGNENNDTPPKTSRKDYTSAIVAAVLSAGIVLCALGAIITANRRRRRERVALSVCDAENNLIDTTGYSDIEDDNSPKSAKYYRRSVVSGTSTLSTVPTGTKLDTELKHASLSHEDAANFEAAADFTDPDGDQSFCAMHNEYNEIAESNLEAPQSPVWSVDNYSMNTPYSTEEDYLAARHRWHQLNDPDYIGVPDHHSVGGYEHSENETNSLNGGDRSIKAASIA